MLDHGHPDAGLYPIAMVRDEAAIVRRRLNAEFVTAATLTKGAIIAVLAEDGHKLFTEQCSSLTED